MRNDWERIVIFSGTTEGRSLSEKLSAEKIPHTVCVATEYGELMQPKSENVLIKEGRLDKNDMLGLFGHADMVIDATHPFATAVTENIKNAAKSASILYVRVLREEEPCCDDIMTSKYHDDIPSCIEALNQTGGNILFTTGSKDLPLICSLIDDITRVYVRILPSIESLKICEKAGIRNNHIIAMHGPFTEDMNIALIRQYNIKVLVTKDSGKAGGVDEKILACKKAGIPCYCIKRPKHETGVSVEEAYEIIKDNLLSRKEVDSKREITFNIVAAGMGQRQGLTLEAALAIDSSDVIFGAKRLIDIAENKRKYPYYLAKDIIEKVEELINEDVQLRTVSVLFSGDIGFYSGAAKFEEGMKKWSKSCDDIEIKITRFAGISSVAALSAKIGKPYSDTAIISIHGKNSDDDIEKAVDKLIAAKKGYILLSDGEDIQKIAKILKNRRADARIWMGERISYPDEKVENLSLKESLAARAGGPVIIYVEI